MEPLDPLAAMSYLTVCPNPMWTRFAPADIQRAFDSTGRHYDQTGNFTEWWDNKTVEAFTSKVNCFVNQYHEFTVPGPDDKPLHVNGALTLGENIADAGGLSAAFKAWKQIETKKPSQLLPGLQDFTRDQLFFISYANWWCGKDRKEAAINRIYQDPHAPKWARILVSFLSDLMSLFGTNECILGHNGEFPRIQGELPVSYEAADL